jgi:3-oxoadipyl-CoA thiolase
VRTDDLAAVPIKALMARIPRSTGQAVDEVYLRLRQPGRRGQPQRRAHGAAAGRPAGQRARHHAQPALRLGPRCGRHAARAIRAGEIDFAIAGGVESMTRAPFVMGKARGSVSSAAEIYDTTIGWRFINPLMKAQYGVDSMPETGENVAEEFQVTRADQDAFALRSQQRAAQGDRRGLFAEEIVAGRSAGGKAGPSSRQGRASAPDTTLEGSPS